MASVCPETFNHESGANRVPFVVKRGDLTLTLVLEVNYKFGAIGLLRCEMRELFCFEKSLRTVRKVVFGEK